MSVTRRRLAATALTSPFWLSASAPVFAQSMASDDPAEIAVDAYIYGYSLITTEVTRVQMSNVAVIDPENSRAPMGQFLNISRYPPANYRGVSAPNADTLYSLAWIDLGTEPMVFSHPDMGKRYYLFPMYSLWMPVIASPGQRTDGGGAAKYLITGPGWDGEVPPEMTEIKSSTRYMVIIGRTYASGTEEDFKIVNRLQNEYDLRPLSAYGESYVYVAPPVDQNPGFSMTDKPQQVINAIDIATYFSMMARLMGNAAPPPPEDAPILARMKKIGLVPGKPFEITKLDVVTQAAFQSVPKMASDKIFAQRTKMGVEINGWRIPAAAGIYGTDYLNRALIAAFGWPANLPEDAVYPTALVDGKGMQLSGAHDYTLTFPKGQVPPVNGFWSITMYIVDGGWWFYPNPLNKFTVSTRDELKMNDDGSLTLYFQNKSPGVDKEANWLPAPEGEFVLVMRMYWPKPGGLSILPPGKGTWAPPPVVNVAGSAL